MVNLNTIYTDRTSMSLNVPQLNVPNSSFRSGSNAGPLANYRSDQIRTTMGTQQSVGPYASIPNQTPVAASIYSQQQQQQQQQQQPTTVATLGAPNTNNALPTIHSIGSFISHTGQSGSPGADSNENDLMLLINRIQNGTLKNLKIYILMLFRFVKTAISNQSKRQ